MARGPTHPQRLLPLEKADQLLASRYRLAGQHPPLALVDDPFDQYALHAPLTYMLVIYGVAWLAILAANIGLGIVIHLLLGRRLDRAMSDWRRQPRRWLASASAP